MSPHALSRDIDRELSLDNIRMIRNARYLWRARQRSRDETKAVSSAVLDIEMRDAVQLRHDARDEHRKTNHRHTYHQRASLQVASDARRQSFVRRLVGGTSSFGLTRERAFSSSQDYRLTDLTTVQV